MTNKDKVIARLNELRIANNLPPYDKTKLKMTIEEMEALIYRLETPSDANGKPTPPTTADLLRKLNVIRSHIDLPRLKSWKGNRAALEKQVEKLEAETKHITIQHIPAHVADGVKTRRAIDTTKTQAAIRKMDKRRKQKQMKEAKATAKAIALSHGFASTLMLEYLLWKDTTRPTLAGDALKADIEAYIKQRDAAGLKTPKKGAAKAPKDGVQRRSRSSDSVTSGDIADALKLEPRAVRIKLRAIESKIPKAWRVADERWGFKPAHKADIIKLVKG